MNGDDREFSRRILAKATSPRVAAECFAQEADAAGIPLTDLQKTVLMVLRYDDIVQVHGVAEVVETMAPDLWLLAEGLARVGCHDHALAIRAIAEEWSANQGGLDLQEFLGTRGDFDDVTLELTQDTERVRRQVLFFLTEVV